METVVIEATDPDDRAHCYAIRVQVFCGEQNVSRDLEFDGLDDQCRHYLALLANTPAGTARSRPLGDGRVKFERVAVYPEHRGRDIGKALMLRALEDAAADNMATGVLNAQLSAAGFYENLGFVRIGEIFMEAGIEHVHMTRDL